MSVLIRKTVCRGNDFVDFARPQQNGRVEISVVTAGSGWHRLLNETTECQVGDMYILQGALPHGYCGEGLTVQTLTFPAERQAEFTLYAEFIRNSMIVWGLSNG